MACANHRHFDSASSNNYRKHRGHFKIEYGKGSAEGSYGSDTLTIGGLSADRHTFAEVVKATNFNYTKYDGVLGLAFPLPHDKIKSPLDSFLAQGLITERHFSIKLSPNISSEYGSQLVIGGLDPVHIASKVHYFLLNEKRHWQFRMSSVTVKSSDKTFCNRECNVMLNSGSSLIAGPREEMDRLHIDVLNATKLEYFDRYAVDCESISRLPTISFLMRDINGYMVKYSIKAIHYIRIFQVCASFPAICLSLTVDFHSYRAVKEKSVSLNSRQSLMIGGFWAYRFNADSSLTTTWIRE